MSMQPNHLLVVTQDQESVRISREEGVEPGPREFLEVGIRCEADRSGFEHHCVAWFECDCWRTITSDQREAISELGEGPCPDSPTGRHHPVGDLIMYPSHECWAQVCDFATDVAHDLVDKHRLSPGAYRVWVHLDHEDLEFELAEVVLGTIQMPGGDR